MDKVTFYREQLLYFLDREDPEAMLDWIEELPDLDQPDVFRLMATLLQERSRNTGEQEWIELSNQVKKKIDEFEEEILDYKLYKELFLTAGLYAAFVLLAAYGWWQWEQVKQKQLASQT